MNHWRVWSALGFFLLACDPGGPSPLGTAGGGAPEGGAAGDAGTGGAAGTGADLLIDDFEDGDTSSAYGPWYTYTDATSGGQSVATLATSEGYQSVHSLQVDYTLERAALGYDPFIGVGNAFGPLDLTGYQGVSYTYRGAAHRVRIETSDVTDYDFFGFNVPASDTWRTVVIPFSLLAQGGWGSAGPVVFNPTHATVISWEIQAASGTSGSLLLDDVTIVREVPAATPDLVVRPPEPPADEVLASTAIPNPLQQRAMLYLDAGSNLTNWLEQGLFDDFDTYNEQYVARLAAAGFKSLRLPVDLDLYAQSTFDGVTATVTIDPQLFIVLDSFDQWTAAHGLGLTIDYHQYDRSLDFADAASLAEAVELWRQVAAHFAASPREDLFFELLNEPALSVSGTAPSAAQWTDLASRMITAIRTQDGSHTIIFGDVQWYDIASLTERTPFADPNVVYSFHFYEPFIFTHQGASWAGMSSTHDLPYPYSEARWSEYSGDFGFTSLNESWQLAALQTYYQDGTKSALRNRILAAKRWGVEHDVPVICNEFGAYDAASRLEDRVRYYTDLRSIFGELEIPWQIWFMIMDPTTGTVDPEIATALGLGG